MSYFEGYEATCQTFGKLSYYKCSSCGKMYYDAAGENEIPSTDKLTVLPFGHRFSWVIDKEATETEAGSKHLECSVCHAKKEAVEIPATGSEHVHSYTDKVVAPTCTKDGYTEHTCTCGYSYRDTYVGATGHSDADNDGNCDVCGIKLGDDKPTDPTDPDKTDSPQTGDNFNAAACLAIMSVSGIAAYVTMIYGKRKKESEAE